MTLPVLIVGGAVLVLTLTMVLNGSEPVLVDEAAARETFALDWPEQTIDRVLVATDHRVAVVLAEGQAHVVFTIGSRVALRALNHAERRGSTWRLDFGDFGVPPLVVELPDDASEVLSA